MMQIDDEDSYDGDEVKKFTGEWVEGNSNEISTSSVNL